jgi:hypothetical protein
MCSTFGNGTVLHEQVAQNIENRVLNIVLTSDKAEQEDEE